MTKPRADFPTEFEFWDALRRRLADVLSARATLAQFRSWLGAATMSGRPLPRERTDQVIAGLALILSARRIEKRTQPSAVSGQHSAGRGRP